MVKTILTAIALFVLALAVPAPARSQAKEQKPPADQKMDMSKKDMKMEGLKMASCDPACGFRVVSHDEAEIVDIVKTHAKSKHNHAMTDEEVKKMIKDAPSKGMKGAPGHEEKPPKP